MPDGRLRRPGPAEKRRPPGTAGAKAAGGHATHRVSPASRAELLGRRLLAASHSGMTRKVFCFGLFGDEDAAFCGDTGWITAAS
ncbi:hypothetical protein STRTUCAR8_00966 [Streptomyces turgidiscabies Car8]|uniref:Uncharacterized protein n=1 Tax=Streptomyces turgidiscabies (strain Car8) TaxID=698760 RepID=L7FJP7_STRT8|nr:hypothetical protein STRTUCAR8_00966 [Streptomyces turgidiscabies Car8]